MHHEIDIDRRGDGERRSRELGAVVATLATQQNGVVSREQLRRIGLTEDEIDGLIASGWLHPLHRGVYAVGHRRLTREGRYLAAVLSAGRRAVLSHRSAASLWALRATKENLIDVTVPGDRRGDGIVLIHRSVLSDAEITTHCGVPVTKPLRTILDLAQHATQRELERAIRQAEYDHLTTTSLLAEAVHERPRRRGNKNLRKALVVLGEVPGYTRSPLEDEFTSFLRRNRLPIPELNREIEIRGRRFEADCAWPEAKLIAELDGRDAHVSLSAFESDRARDSALLAAGWRTVRVTKARLRRDRSGLARELREMLAI